MPPLSQSQEKRLVFAFLVQPFVAATFGFLTFPIIAAVSRLKHGGSTPNMLEAAISYGTATGIAGVLVALLVALPIVVWLRRRGPITLTRTLVSGAVLGNLPLAVIFGLVVAGRAFNPPDTRPDQAVAVTALLLDLVGPIAFGAAVGLTCAAAFWWIAGRHLQDEEPGTRDQGLR